MADTPVKQCLAAKAVIKDLEGKVLVLRQSFEQEVDGAGQYHLPGGMVEPGETLHQALIREIHEETHLEVNVVKVLSVEEWRANIRGDDCYFVGIFFECSLIGGELDTHNEETSGYAWVTKEKLKEYSILDPSKTVIEKALL